MSETGEQQATTREAGRCEKAALEVVHSSWNQRFNKSLLQMATAVTIDRLAADVAAIKEKVNAISPEDVAHLVESEKAFAELFAEQRDAAIRERDEARAEVERLRAELVARPAANSSEIPNSSPADPPPADQDSEDSLDGLQMLVHAWAVDRKILSNSSPQAQLVKLTEEVGELAAGVCRNDRQKIIDAIGDTTVVLIVMCGILRLSFRRCLQAAYDEIKERSGTIRGGVFVKVADATPQPAAPAAGWLTDRERRAVAYFAQVCRDDLVPDEWTDSACVLRSFLTRAGSLPAAPPAVWLTERERHVLSSMLSERPVDSSLHWRDDVLPVFRSILSRAGSPPVVVLPTVFQLSSLGDKLVALQQVKDAMDAAGVAWKEVGRE